MGAIKSNFFRERVRQRHHVLIAVFQKNSTEKAEDT